MKTTYIRSWQFSVLFIALSLVSISNCLKAQEMPVIKSYMIYIDEPFTDKELDRLTDLLSKPSATSYKPQIASILYRYRRPVGTKCLEELLKKNDVISAIVLAQTQNTAYLPAILKTYPKSIGHASFEDFTKVLGKWKHPQITKVLREVFKRSEDKGDIALALAAHEDDTLLPAIKSEYNITNGMAPDKAKLATVICHLDERETKLSELLISQVKSKKAAYPFTNVETPILLLESSFYLNETRYSKLIASFLNSCKEAKYVMTIPPNPTTLTNMELMYCICVGLANNKDSKFSDALSEILRKLKNNDSTEIKKLKNVISRVLVNSGNDKSKDVISNEIGNMDYEHLEKMNRLRWIPSFLLSYDQKLSSLIIPILDSAQSSG